MRFTKMHGAGNDFIIINNMNGEIPQKELPRIVRKLCAPHTSIGADGAMIVVKAVNGGDYGMLFFNSDGSIGEMCGNGARCISRYGYENGLAGEVQRVETTAGLVIGHRISKRLYQVRLNDPGVLDLYRGVTLDGVEYPCAYVELGYPGIPHAVLNMPGWSEMDRDKLRELGRRLRFAEVFPKGANVTFAELIGKDRIKAVTFERGVEDFTLACGTGCGSTVSVFTLRGLVSGKDVHVEMPGGELVITLDTKGKTVENILLTGPTNIVCEGEITDEDL